MNKSIFVDLVGCIGCHTCEMACVMSHSESRKAGHPLEAFNARLHIYRKNDTLAAIYCHHCLSAGCAAACPTEALVFTNGTVQLVEERCDGCGKCIPGCPFGAIDVFDMAEEHPKPGVTATPGEGKMPKAIKCDLCVGREAGPACVQYCPVKAVMLLDFAELTGLPGAR